ncbi:unnamed protein product [Diplocarpon coronariae]|uniref:Nucleoside 2-deoxyribosyltransferase n=1 Tax=Diplocarpon coronariae TaxID=2795749 RepID=A0A218YZA0_9HELO|nr:hypothetical protein B2J93_1075 [Marssonina coronariae]
MNQPSSPTPGPTPSRCRVVLAPHSYIVDRPTIFLSGSIDAPPATWQAALTAALGHLPITILNPHRADWDASWREDGDSARFREQVTWELDAIEAAHVVAVCFRPGSPAPVTLLELGLCARGKKVAVACPEGYEKRGNVQVVCRRFGIEVVRDVGELADRVVKLLGGLGQVETA